MGEKKPLRGSFSTTKGFHEVESFPRLTPREGTARLRVTLSAAHTAQQVDSLLAALEAALS